MATAEGVFPKVGGDPGYYSEANRFAGAGGFIYIGSTLNVGSQTAIQTAGSLLIRAGSLSNPCHISMYGNWNIQSEQKTKFTIQISGLTGNASWVMAGSDSNTVSLNNFIFNATLGSPLLGRGLMIGYQDTISSNSPGPIPVSASLNNLHTGSPIVISFRFEAGAADTRVDTVNV